MRSEGVCSQQRDRDGDRLRARAQPGARAPDRPGDRGVARLHHDPPLRDPADAHETGPIRAALESGGQPIGPCDAMIAGTARQRNLTLVTHNVREFARVACLRRVDWREPSGRTRWRPRGQSPTSAVPTPPHTAPNWRKQIGNVQRPRGWQILMAHGIGVMDVPALCAQSPRGPTRSSMGERLARSRRCAVRYEAVRRPWG